MRAMRPLPLRRTTVGASTTATSRSSGASRGEEELLGAGVEEVGRADDDRAEQDERDDVEHRLRDERPEQDRERLAHAADAAAGEHHGARGLAEAGRQRRRHQHADHRRRGDVAAAERHASAARSARSRTRIPRAGTSRSTSARPRPAPSESVGAHDALDDAVDADLSARRARSARRRRCAATPRATRRRIAVAAGPPVGRGIERGQALRADARPPSAGRGRSGARCASRCVGGLGARSSARS